MLQNLTGKMKHSNILKIGRTVLFILTISLVIPFLLGILRKTGFTETIWMTIIIVALCIIIIYSLMKGTEHSSQDK